MQSVETQLWMWDREVSEALAVELGALTEHSDVRFLMLCAEWAMHGIPWMFFSFIAMVVALRNQASFDVQYVTVLLFFAVCADMVLVGLIKVTVRRPRPVYNRDDMMLGAPIADRYSFPSGHTSRAAMLSTLGLTLSSWSFPMELLAYTFPLAFGLSRVILGRHYVGDVLGGLLLGIFGGFAFQLLPHSSVAFLQDSFPSTFGSAV